MPAADMVLVYGGEGGIPSPFMGEPLWVPAADMVLVYGGEGGSLTRNA